MQQQRRFNRGWLGNHKTLILSIGFLVLFSFAVAHATPPTSPYTAGATLDPQCAPGATNCTVAVGVSQWTNVTGGINYSGGTVSIGSSTASGTNSVAFGNNTTAGSVNDAVFGTYNTGGGDPANWVGTDPLFEVGNGTDSADLADALEVLKDGDTTVGGSLYVNGSIGSFAGSVGIGTTTPNAELDVEGDGAIYAAGNFGSGIAAPNFGGGTLLEWIPSVAAFRAGGVNSSQWDTVNIGQYSTAMGYGDIASGTYSTALGGNNTATGENTTAFGGSDASGINAIALAGGNASGYDTIASGYHTTAHAAYSAVFGTGNVGGGDPLNWVATDPIFEIGNGDPDVSAISDAFTVLKNGNIGIATANPNYLLTIAPGLTANSGAGQYVLDINPSVTGATDGTTQYTASNYNLNAVGTNSVNTITGLLDSATDSMTAGTITNAVGSFAGVSINNASSVTNGYSYEAEAGISGTGNISIFKNYTAFTPNITGSGTIGTMYGFVTSALKVAGVTTAYDFYATGPNDLNYFAGDVGIGVPIPTFLLQVGSPSVLTGTAVAQFANAGGTCTVTPSATGGITCTSDMNLKKNITNLSDSSSWAFNNNITVANTDVLDKVLALNPVDYNWNVEQNTDPKHAGFIAQEVQQVFPELVSTDPNTHLLSLNYTGLVPYTVEAIKEMNVNITSIDDLTKTNTWRDAIITWLGDAKNGITSLVVQNQICVDDQCLTKDDIHQLLQMEKQSGGSEGAAPTGMPSISSSDSTTQTPDVTPPVVTTPPDATSSPDVTPSDPSVQ